jgi:hypothetical protein
LWNSSWEAQQLTSWLTFFGWFSVLIFLGFWLCHEYRSLLILILIVQNYKSHSKQTILWANFFFFCFNSVMEPEWRASLNRFQLNWWLIARELLNV